MTQVLELYGEYTQRLGVDWTSVIRSQHCPYLGRECVKTRKSNPEITIGTCSVLYGKKRSQDLIICPHRLLQRNQIFIDCLHLLTNNEPGNELHLIPEVSLPGGDVDYFVVAVRNGKVKDFVGIELQSLDSTGTVWPIRQQFLRSVGAEEESMQGARHDRPGIQDADEIIQENDLSNLHMLGGSTVALGRKNPKGFGMNWKMTAKTILMQLHHKITTFEHINRHLVIVIQDHFFSYLQREFSFGHISNAKLGDSLHMHVYSLVNNESNHLRLALNNRYSTDEQGLARALGLQAEANLELAQIHAILEAKLSEDTLLRLV